MKKAKLFKNGQSQAVRLPKEYRLKGEHVFIKKQGNNLILIPAENSWDSLIASLAKFSDDFMTEREQPEIQKRELFDEIHA
ncbi:type II toxin-antitoxin system antitoxin VapB [Thermodesulfovibrio yellowstonii]|uniref:Antitoxin n=1 Tax=Thermodesulfovibrio yellowstonii TaxID=28262 RepID=A0A9W6LJU7_9BACT|nr:type II toxin-antitoxin system VapB family antitoxin [Thermodesulfovibrio islandicus]GLI52939.1 antitoxin [Thermodesulfovibrio islandicus]